MGEVVSIAQQKQTHTTIFRIDFYTHIQYVQEQ